MPKEVRKWLRPPEKIVEKEEKYSSLDQFFLDEDNQNFMNVYDIEKDESWLNDVFAVALVNGVKEGKSFIKQDFSEITLAGAKLLNATLKDSSFKFGNLVAVDFFGSNLENVDFTACDLRKADFRKCNLKNANFTEANLAGAIFDDSDLTGVTFADSYVMGAKLGNAKIDEKARSEFQKMQQLIEDAQKGIIPLHHLPNNMLKMLDWRRMYLGGVDLSKLDLTGISLIGVNLSGTMQQVVAVPPTYIDNEEEKKQIEEPNIIPQRPDPKPESMKQSLHEEYEFIAIFDDEKLTPNDKPGKHLEHNSNEKKYTSGKDEVKEKTDTKQKTKKSAVTDTDETGAREDENAIKLRIEEMQKRIDKSENVKNPKSKGKIRT